MYAVLRRNASGGRAIRLMTAAILAMLILLPTLLPMLSVDWWWVRIWDFPRLQLAVAYLLGLVLLWLVADKGWERLGLTAILGVAFLYQLTWIVPYLSHPCRRRPPRVRIPTPRSAFSSPTC